MKVIVEVNLNDIWPEYEYQGSDDFGRELSEPVGTLGKQVEAAIAEEVKNKVWNLVREQVTKKLTDEVYNVVQNQVSAKVDAYTEAFLTKGTFTKGTTEYSVKDYVESFITEHKLWSSFATNLNKTAENFAKEVQKKYDLMFATQIVVNLKNSGMLVQEKLDALFSDRT